jgi:hypothetical protein
LRLRRTLGAGLAINLACALGLAAYAGTIAYQSPAGLVGNQNFGGTLGMDFDVNCTAIAITQLGAFDSGQDGFKRTINVYIYDRDTQTAVYGPMSFTGEDGALVGGDRFKPLDTPLILPGGFHGSVVAENYGAEEMLRNPGVGATVPPPMDSGGGLISFVGSARYGTVQGSYPGTPDTGPANRYHAGTFEFEAGPAPEILAPPLSQTVPEGADAAFAVVARGVEPLSYQWQFNGTDLSGETLADLHLASPTADQAGLYSVKVTDAAGGARCTSANLIVASAGPVLAFDASTISSANQNSYAPGVADFFDVAPGTSINITELGTVLFQDVLTNTLTVQLYRITSSTNRVLATVTFDETDAPEALPSGVPLFQYMKPLAQPLALGPGSYALVLYGSNAGAAYPRDNIGIPGLTINNAIAFKHCAWANSPGGPGVLPQNSESSANLIYLAGTFKMTVSGAPVLAEQPLGGVYAPGANFALGGQAGGSLPLSYQWYRGASLLAGATNATLNFTNVTSAQAGDYTLVVNNLFGKQTSAVARIVVAPPPAMALSLYPGVTIQGIQGLHYQVEYRTDLDPQNTWHVLQDIPSLPSATYLVYDSTPATAPKRFYRVTLLP